MLTHYQKYFKGLQFSLQVFSFWLTTKKISKIHFNIADTKTPAMNDVSVLPVLLSDLNYRPNIVSLLSRIPSLFIPLWCNTFVTWNKPFVYKRKLVTSIFLVAVVHHLLSMPRIFFYIITHKFNHPEKWFRAIMYTLIDNNLRWVWRESKQLAAFRGSVLSLHSTRVLHRHLSLQVSGVSTLLTFMATHKIKSRGGGTPQNRVKVAFIDDLFGYDFFLIIRPYA